MHRLNNFDFLRMLFASFVIITHSYPLTGRKYEAECDIFCQYTGVNLSYLGVMGFFAISGYLIFQSLMRSKNIIDYLWKRALRIFPGLFVVSVLTMVVLSFIYKGEGSYWQDMKVWFYPIKQTLFFYHWGSPPSLGEIFMGNRYSSHATNGSLWTIPYEFTAYILLLFLLIFRINRNGEKVISYLLAIVAVFLFLARFLFDRIGIEYNIIAYIFRLDHKQMIHLYVFFVIGCFLASIKIENFSKKIRNILLSILSILSILSFILDLEQYTIPSLYPIIVILIGISSWSPINKIGVVGDLSYGMYIYSFPVQQLIEYFFKPTVSEMMLYSFIIVPILGYLSWNLVEKPMLKYKNIFR